MSVWGPLAERYETERPRKLLALDGGGIRGIMTLEVLAKIESLLAQATGKGSAFRLCQFFDYIAGTSTGAIIAAGLARGMSAQELLTFYQQTGPAMFDKAFLLQRWKTLYKSEPLAKELQKTFGEKTTLSPEDLCCLFLAVTRNVTTDSPWPVSSNPLAKYNQRDRKDCNLQIPLWRLVRASTAAPIFFPPEVLPWDPNDPAKTFVFVDGGVTPYNNPAFLLYRMATLAPYKLGWKTGERKLLLISVGTGAAPTLDGDILSPEKNAVSNLAGLPGALMYGALVDQDINCRTVGRCVYGAPIDREVGDLIPRDVAGQVLPLSQDSGRAFLYARYNAELTRAGLDAMGLQDVKPEQVSKLDSVQFIPDLRRVGQKVGDEVKIEHFGTFV
ncbi:MAG TPA: patatin-like phospholipase family protein [Thermoanaerobaculia bacterium]|nr:patatin-like phospholipase family protein [Thermoanaerobaculia bacterium]